MAQRQLAKTSAALMLSMLLSGCPNDDNPAPVSTVPPPIVQKVASAEVAQPLFFIATIGEIVSAPLTINDQNGRTVSVVVDWQTDAPNVAAVDSMGNITAIGIGSAKVLATIEAADTQSGMPITRRFDVIVAEPKPTTVVVAPDDLVADLTVIAYNEDATYTARVRLDATSHEVNVNDGFILSDLRLAGHVVGTEIVDGVLIVDVDSTTLGPQLQNGQVRVEVTMDDIVEPSEFTFPAKSGNPNTKTWQSSVAEATTITAESLPTEVGDFGPLLAQLFPGEFSTSISENFSCSASAGANPAAVTSALNTDINYNDIRVVFAEGAEFGLLESASVSIDLEFDVTFDGYLQWAPEVTGKLSCKKIIKAPYLQAEMLVISIPFGVGFSLEAQDSALAGRANISGTMPVTISMVVGYDDLITGSPSIEAPLQIDANTDALDINYEQPAGGGINELVSTYKLDVNGFIAPRAGIGVGISFGIYQLMDHLQGGFRASFDIASSERQMRDEAFKANANLVAYGKRNREFPYQNFAVTPLVFALPAIIILVESEIIDFDAILNYERELDLAASPTGVTQVSTLEPEVGEIVDFGLTLAPANFLGVYQIDEVIVYRVSGAGQSATLDEYERIVAAPNQTVFNWQWTPEESDIDDARFVVFMQSSILPWSEYQVDDVFALEVQAREEPPVDLEITEYFRLRADAGVEYRPRDGDELGNVISADDEIEELEGDMPLSANLNVGNGRTRGQFEAGPNGLSASYDVDVREACGKGFARSRLSRSITIRGLQPGQVITPVAVLTGPSSLSVAGDDPREDAELEVVAELNVNGVVTTPELERTVPRSASGRYRNSTDGSISQLGWYHGEIPRPPSSIEYIGGTVELGGVPRTVAENIDRIEINISLDTNFGKGTPVPLCTDSVTNPSASGTFTLQVLY